LSFSFTLTDVQLGNGVEFTQVENSKRKLTEQVLSGLYVTLSLPIFVGFTSAMCQDFSLNIEEYYGPLEVTISLKMKRVLTSDRLLGMSR
jgi:hypothetical protein